MANESKRPRSFFPGSLHRRLALPTLLILAGCAPIPSAVPPPAPSDTPPAPMFVADLGVDRQVEDLDAALRQMDFVQELGGYVAAVGRQEQNGAPRMTVELRVPHKYTGRVAEILSSEFGERTFINVLSGEVSVRNARLRRELAALQVSLKGLSGADLVKAKDQIELLDDIIAFQLRRTEFLYVEIHLTEPR
jgi:hypothetical protein